LSGEAPIRVGVNENYVLIAFFNNEKVLQFVIQIDHGSIETAKLWLKYLGVLVEDEDWLESVVLPYWENIFGTDKYDDVFLSNVKWVSQFDPIISSGCTDGCCWYTSNYILNQTTGKTAPKSNTIKTAAFASSSNFVDLSTTSDFNKGLSYLESKIIKDGEPVVIGVHYNKGVDPYNKSNPATYHFMVVVGKGYDKIKKMNYFRFYEVGTYPENEIIKGKNEGNKLYVDKTKRTISGNRGYVDADGQYRFYTITEVRQSQ
jgi:hypothetical protein